MENQNYKLVYNDREIYAVMSVVKKNGNNSACIFFSKNTKHLTDTELRQKIKEPIMDKHLLRKKTINDLKTKLFKSYYTFMPLCFGNVDFVSLKKESEIMIVSPILQDIQELINREIPNILKSAIFINNLKDEEICSIMNYFNKKQKTLEFNNNLEK